MTGADPRSSGGRHTIADHMLGDLGAHGHGPDADHDHDHEAIDPGRLEDNPIWLQDNVFLRSVGIDIGSAGTQVIFSGIHLRRHGEDLTSRYIIVERRTLYESPVSLTPYHDEHRIDERALGEIIDAAYAAARIGPGDIDTGVVILTGEALRRENAEAIAGILAEKGGDFVTATAGHHMEAMLAAFGSGAARASHDLGSRVLNVDIGGGTTKLALIDKGRVIATAALAIGGRLIVVDNDRIVRLDPAGADHARRAGFDWKVGAGATSSELAVVAESMADLLASALVTGRAPDAAAALYLTAPIADLSDIDGIMFSGGVAEYIHRNESRDFGDLGIHLGAALRARAEAGLLGAKLMPAGACIRATALGASEYSVQLSGATGWITNPGKLLPRRNVQVVKPDIDLDGQIVPAAVAAAIKQHLLAFDLAETDVDVAIAFEWAGPPDYQRIRGLADGLASGLADRIAAGKALYVMLDGDIARTLGAILSDEVGITNDMMIIDGILLRDFDYIDLGRIRLPSFTVPITIKSLQFRDNLGGEGPHHHEHAHDHGDGHHHHHHPHGRGDAAADGDRRVSERQ
jgi:ethanolamine utilization protein EutA (predicted chaperonin)